MILAPAYGRDYETAAKALEAWRSGKDFFIVSPLPEVTELYGRYCSIRDAEQGGWSPQILFNCRSQITEVTHD